MMTARLIEMDAGLGEGVERLYGTTGCAIHKLKRRRRRWRADHHHDDDDNHNHFTPQSADCAPVRDNPRVPARRRPGNFSTTTRALVMLVVVTLLHPASGSNSTSKLEQQQQQQQQRSRTERHAPSSIFDSLLGTDSSSSPSSDAAANQATGVQSSGAGGDHHQQQQQHMAYRMSQSPDKVSLPGDILLGGLFPIHHQGTKVECGQINRDRGIQRLEAMLYALDRINGDAELLPNIKLGAILLDSCSSSTYALNQSLEFIRASINTVESSAFECKDKSTPRPKYGSKMIAGVIGGSYSEVSLQVANLLRLFRIPQVSYASTGTALSDKTLYDLFARTVPSDMFQARAIADIVKKLGWSYVSLVSSEGLYGDSGSKEFTKQASNRRVCIATHEKISPTIGDSSYDLIVNSLFKRNATGVVLFTRAEDTRSLLLAVKRANLSQNFAWVAADGWGTHQKLVEGVEEVASGAITVELEAKAIPGFDQYMKELTPWGNGRNPWFSEYWQEWFDCQLQANLVQQQRLASGYVSGGASARRETQQLRKRRLDSSVNGTRTRRGANFATFAEEEVDDAINRRDVKQFCSPNLRISESNGYRQEQKVQFVVDAVYAMAHALHKAWSHLCGAQPGVVCEALKELNGGEFYTKYLLNVSFKDLAGSEVKFDERGDGLGRYIIYNFRQVRSQQEQQQQVTPSPVPETLPDSIISELDVLAAGADTPIDKQVGGGGEMSTPAVATSIATAPLAPTTTTTSDYQVEHILTSNSAYEYSSVGRWTEDNFNLATHEIQFFQGDHQVPESFCSRPCELGQAKMMRAGDHCCWICKTCAPWEFLPDEFNCQDCGIGRWPVANKTKCFDLPQKYLRWDAIYSLISLSVACLGIALTLFVSIIFVRYIDTPVVKASGRELSFILLAGVAFCHLATFILLSKPTVFICGGQRFLVNFGFALMYGSLLVKTNRISRIFNCARKSAKRPSFISPKSQMLITGILVGIQIFLTIVWFVFEPPGVRADSPEGKRDEVILKCRVKGRSFILSLVYNMILITTCTIYAVKTRKIPENFNESKFIGFTMYTTIVIWLAFVTMFFGTNNSYEIQMNTMCVCISLSAYVTLFCLFSPKISIILLHPDKNVRKLTMNSATYKRAFKPVSSIASADGAAGGGGGGGAAGHTGGPTGATTAGTTHAGGSASYGGHTVGGAGSSSGRGGGLVLQPSGSHGDGPSGGPLSTTSQVLNQLADAQIVRLQESSVVSINLVGGANSASSNCSQKTATSSGATTTGQLALVGVCSNCGAHQLLSMPPAGTQQQPNNIYNNGAARSKPTTCGDKHTAAAAAMALSRSSNQIVTTTNAKVLHNRIGGGGGAGKPDNGKPATLKRAPSDQSMTTAASNQRNVAASAQKNSTCVNSKRQHMGSLSRLNEMTSFTSSGGGGGGCTRLADESISSLVNGAPSGSGGANGHDSFGLNESSLENTPCTHILGSSNVHPSTGHAGTHGSQRRTTSQHKGSDSMLCNQSLQSIDYCSDCCPSLCHCSCPLCSSIQGGIELSGPAQPPPPQRHNSIGVLTTPTSHHDHRHHLNDDDDDDDDERVNYVESVDGDDDDDDQEATPPSGDYDAMCILQLVQQQADDVELAARCHRKSCDAPSAAKSEREKCREQEQQQQQQFCTHAVDQNGAARSQPRQTGAAMEMRSFYSKDPSNNTKTKKTRKNNEDDDNSSSRKRSAPTASASTKSTTTAGSSLAYALQTAAASALGPASQCVQSTSLMDDRRPEVAPMVATQVTAAAAAVAAVTSEPVGTIRASLEMVRSSEAARRLAQVEAAATARQRRKSGCFNYHDDYEYSYGLVESNSESDDRECYFNDHDVDVDADDDELEPAHQPIRRQAPLKVTAAAAIARQHNDQSGEAANRAYGHNNAEIDDDNGDDDDDDDFKHDGRVTLERRYSKRTSKGSTSTATSVSPATGKIARGSTKRARNKDSSSSAATATSKLQLDEHRINSVALIAATLSAGGAIVESSSAVVASTDPVASASGSGGQGDPKGSATPQENLQSTKKTTTTTGDGEKATYLGTF